MQILTFDSRHLAWLLKSHVMRVHLSWSGFFFFWELLTLQLGDFKQLFALWENHESTELHTAVFPLSLLVTHIYPGWFFYTEVHPPTWCIDLTQFPFTKIGFFVIISRNYCLIFYFFFPPLFFIPSACPTMLLCHWFFLSVQISSIQVSSHFHVCACVWSCACMYYTLIYTFIYIYEVHRITTFQEAINYMWLK